MQNANRAEAERLLGIAEKLLQSRDLNGSRDFAILAQETEPLLEGSDQIMAIIDVLLAAEKRVNNHHDWYAILQVDRRSDDLDFIKKQYRRLALLLHPDKSRFYFADHAFKLVADAWAVLSDHVKKSLYDKETSFFFSRVDLTVPGWVQQDKMPARRGGPGPAPGPSVRNQAFDNPRDSGHAAARDEAAEDNSRWRSSSSSSSTFWTTCPYCYRLYEYPKAYEGCCLRCQSCDKSFHGVSIPSLPPLVPGQEAYYCCWGFFPMGFVVGNLGSGGKGDAPPQTGLPNWMPAAVAATGQQAENGGNNGEPAVAARVTTATAAGVSNGNAMRLGSTGRKRGRPRKYPLPS